MTTSIRFLLLAPLLLSLAGVHAQDSDADAESEAAAEAAEVIAEQESEPAAGTEAVEEPDAGQVDQTAGDSLDESADQEQQGGGDDGGDVDMDAAIEAMAEIEAAEAEAATAAETFTVQGHPVYTPEQAELVYSPLVDYLNQATPYRFELALARDFHRYWLDARRGVTPDLVLEEAHLTAYRIDNHGYTPLVKAEEPMTYSLLASADNSGATLQDFVGRRVSSMPAPSLGYLVLSRWYDNPMQQPVIQSNASSWLDAIEIVFSMEAQGAMVPHTLAERYVNMEQVATSREFPGLTLSASPAVDEDIREEIRQALLVLHDDPDHYGALHELDIDRFVEADASEYAGLDDWLSEIITR